MYMSDEMGNKGLSMLKPPDYLKYLKLNAKVV